MSPSDRRDGIGGVGSPDLMAADTDNGVPPDDDPLARRCEERRQAKRVPYRPVAALRPPPLADSALETTYALDQSCLSPRDHALSLRRHTQRARSRVGNEGG